MLFSPFAILLLKLVFVVAENFTYDTFLQFKVWAKSQIFGYSASPTLILLFVSGSHSMESVRLKGKINLPYYALHARLADCITRSCILILLPCYIIYFQDDLQFSDFTYTSSVILFT